MSKQVKTILKFLAIILLAIVQLTLLPLFAIHGVWPNLILILSLVLVLFNDDTDAFLTASLGGLILDLGSPLFFGFNIILNILLVFLIRFMLKKFLTETTFFVFGLVVFLAIIIFDTIISVVTHQFSWINLLINGGYSLIIAIIVYRSLSFNFNRIGTIKIN